MSEGIVVTSKTQIIMVEPTSGSVSVISSGPPGPAGPPGSGGGGGNTNPIDFLGSNTSETKLELTETTDIESRLLLVADNADGQIARVAIGCNKYSATPQFDGGTLGLYNGDGFTGFFAQAFPDEVNLHMSVASGQTNPIFSLFAHALPNILFSMTPTGALDFNEQSVPANPATNVARVYAKDVSGTTKLAMKDSAGTETVFDAGGVGGGSASFPLSYTDGTNTYTIDANDASSGEMHMIVTDGSATSHMNVASGYLDIAGNSGCNIGSGFGLLFLNSLGGNDIEISSGQDLGLRAANQVTLQASTGVGTIYLTGKKIILSPSSGSGDGVSFDGGSHVGHTPISVTGSRAGNAALASLLTALTAVGMISNGTSA